MKCMNLEEKRRNGRGEKVAVLVSFEQVDDGMTGGPTIHHLTIASHRYLVEIDVVCWVVSNIRWERREMIRDTAAEVFLEQIGECWPIIVVKLGGI